MISKKAERAEDDDEDDMAKRKEYAWEKDQQLSLASEAGEDKWVSSGSVLRFGGKLDSGSRTELKDGLIYRRGMCRFVAVVVDCGSSTMQLEPAPTRIVFLQKALQGFIMDFFDQNPLSQLCLMITKDGVAKKLTNMSGSPNIHIKAVKEMGECGGEPSLQNAIDLSVAELRYTPAHATKEVLMILSSLTSTDPGDIHESISKAKECGLRVSVIHMSAEVYVAKKLCKMTSGIHSVMVDGDHFATLLSAHVPPSPDVQHKAQVALVEMGFPTQQVRGVHQCPKCMSAVPHLPCSCSVCDLSLVSAAHLARSYHHLFPVPTFIRVAPQSMCCACKTPLATHKCPSCHLLFCSK